MKTFDLWRSLRVWKFCKKLRSRLFTPNQDKLFVFHTSDTIMPSIITPVPTTSNKPSITSHYSIQTTCRQTRLKLRNMTVIVNEETRFQHCFGKYSRPLDFFEKFWLHFRTILIVKHTRETEIFSDEILSFQRHLEKQFKIYFSAHVHRSLSGHQLWKANPYCKLNRRFNVCLLYQWSEKIKLNTTGKDAIAK